MRRDQMIGFINQIADYFYIQTFGCEEDLEFWVYTLNASSARMVANEVGLIMMENEILKSAFKAQIAKVAELEKKLKNETPLP